MKLFNLQGKGFCGEHLTKGKGVFNMKKYRAALYRFAVGLICLWAALSAAGCGHKAAGGQKAETQKMETQKTETETTAAEVGEERNPA